MPKKFEGKMPPLLMWPDSGKHPAGPTDLQKLYFIDKIPPEKRPHLHNQDQVVMIGGQGSSKCFRIDTPILMYDGTIKSVQDVVPGDQVMGPDSKPRNVLTLGRGRETMYEVKPIKGEPFYCNESHILSLKHSGHGNYTEVRVNPSGSTYTKPPRYGGQEIINVPISEYLSWPERKKSHFLLYRADTLDFPTPRELLIDPYIFGLWLGDGHKHNFSISTVDKEIEEAVRDYTYSIGKEMSILAYEGKCPVLRIPYETENLKSLKVQNNKHIPQSYKTASIEDRRQLLAGLIDSDGTMRSNCFHVIQKIKVLAEDIAFLARSLGLAAYIKERQCSCVYKGEKKTGTYYQVNISGNLDNIPTRLVRKQATPRLQKKSVLVTGFSLTKLPEEDYYGFTVDGDHLFLLGDFTVVHNTFGGVKRLLDVCATNPGTKAYLGAMDFQVLKRNTWDVIRDTFTINDPWDHPAILNSLHTQCNELQFRNTSSLTCINLEKHLGKKIGYTAGIQMIDEVHLLPNEDAYKLIVGRGRGTPPEIRQLIMCTNPEKTKEGWMNVTFELEKFDGIDTSERPVEMLVGPRCSCQFCTKCRIFKRKEISWEQTGEEEWRCPSCHSFRDFYTWLGKKYYCPGEQQYIRVIKSESGHNPHLPDDYFQSMSDAYDETYFDIMVRGKTNVNLRDEYCFKKYIPEVHELDLPVYIDYDQDIYWGLDFNRTPQCSVLAQFDEIDGAEVFLTKEEIRLSGKPSIEFPNGRGEGATVLDVAKYFVDKHRHQYKGTTVHIYGDPAGFRKTSTSHQNSFEIICDYLEENGFLVNLVADISAIGVSDRLELTDYWLEAGLLRFNPPSMIPWTCKSMAESKMDENDIGENKKVSKKQDWNAARSTNMSRVYCVSHFNEALGYMIWKLFPMSGANLSRSATLPDGTTIREDNRGRVKVDKGASSEDDYYTKELVKLKEQQENPKVGNAMGVKISLTIASDDNGM